VTPRAIANWVWFWACRASILALGAYLLPAIIGVSRHVTHVGPLSAVNLIMGWTLLGWVACLLWAVCGGPQAAGRVPTQNTVVASE
jgi:hypothetical protein